MKKAIVVHSGGMDSSICLAIAIKEFGVDQVLSLSFRYNQRHFVELEVANLICKKWGVDHKVLNIDCLSEITKNALTNKDEEIVHLPGESPNTLVVGRNGLMARIASIHADSLGAQCIYMGVIEIEEANSGYRDCSRNYMDIIESALKLDFNNQEFEIRTPVVFMTKLETYEKAEELGVLSFILENTITCYNGIPYEGCMKCPACKLRNEGLKEYIQKYPDFEFSYKNKL